MKFNLKQPQIHNLGELREAVGAENLRKLQKTAFEGTVCGAYIVRRSCYDTENHMLAYPFTLSELWRSLEVCTGEAELIFWDLMHGCDDCGGVSDLTGFTPVNPKCKTCKGEGVVI